MHQLMDIMGPSSRHFCKCCWITKDEFKAYPTMIGIIRTPENYADKFVDNRTLRYFNIKKKSNLNTLSDYNINNNWTSDLLHDFLEGNTKLLINDVCQFLFDLNLISEAELNERIDQFNYGELFKTKKPTASIFKRQIKNTKTIKQTGYQTLLLMQTLPYLIMDKLLAIDDKNLIFEKVQNIISLVSYHLCILSYIMSPVLPNFNEQSFENLIRLYIDLYCYTFGSDRLINKTHHILHYPRCIVENGPPLFYSCAKYENNHLWQKTYAHVSNNRKNLTYSLCKLDSYRLLYNLCSAKENNELFKIYPQSKTENIEDLKGIFPSLIHKQKIFTHIKYRNEEFRKDLFICIKNEDENGQNIMFGKIIIMSLVNDRLYFHVKVYKSISFSSLFWGYEIVETNQLYSDIDYDKLSVKRAFCVWVPYNINYIIIAKTTLELEHY